MTGGDGVRGGVRGEWPGVEDREVLAPARCAAADRVADAARDGDWSTVLAGITRIAGPDSVGVNSWRIGGRSLFTPLHQAAWHGAAHEVVAQLLERGAWRSLRDREGRRPVDVARERGHHHLLDLLATTEPTAAELERYAARDRHLDALVHERTAGLAPVASRPVPTEVVEVEALDPLWFPYPGMYGGFAVSWRRDRIHVESWCRVVEGSGEAHDVTEHGVTLVGSGFV